MKFRFQSVLLIVATFMIVAAPSAAFAQDEAAISSGDIVRRKLLYRSTRFEIAPQVGVTLADSFQRNLLVGANFAYHLTNDFGISATGYYGMLHWNTGLADNVAEELTDQELSQISYSYIQFAADLGISWVPIFGKFSILQSTSVAYDFHITGGVAVVSEAAEPAIDGGAELEDVQGLRPGGFLQFGARIFLTDMLSWNFEIKNMLYSRAEASGGNADPEFRNTVIFATGLSIFLPGEVKISR